MEDNKLSFLDKNDTNKEIQAPFSNERAIIENIWEILVRDNYGADEIKSIIELFRRFSENNMRLLYSEITEKVFRNPTKSDSIESRFLQIFSDSKVIEDADLTKVLKRFYDHVHLAYIQHYNIHSTDKQLENLQKEIGKVEKQSKEVKKQSNKTMHELKNANRETITILGIFSSIVISVTGVLSFSENLLSSIDSVSSFRLFCIGGMILIFFLAVVNTLTSFIGRIHDPEQYPKSHIWIFITITIVIAIFGIIFDSKFCLIKLQF